MGGNRIDNDAAKPCLFLLEDRTLGEAEEACIAQGGRLANIDTAEDGRDLQTFAKGWAHGIGLRNSGAGWKFHGSDNNVSDSFLYELFGNSWFQPSYTGCARLNGRAAPDRNVVFFSWLHDCHDQRMDWICEGTLDNTLTTGVVATGDLKADEGAFCVWHLPENEYLDYLPNDEGGFDNTDFACRLQTGSSRNKQCAFDPSSRRRQLVSQRGHPSNKANYPVMGREVGWMGAESSVPFLSLGDAYDVAHCHFTIENSGFLRVFAFQHMYERSYPGSLRRTCGCGYEYMSNLVSRCDCTRNGVRSNNCAVWHRETLRKATEPVPVKCNNCNADTNL